MHADLGILRGQLEAIVGGAQVAAGIDQTALFAVDGVIPELVVRPGTQEEVAQVVATCYAAGAAMLPWGGGTAMGLGNPPPRVEVMIHLDRLDRIVEWDPANLCVTAEAGLRLGALQEILARDKAILPLDPPASHRLTLGGLVAANQSGPGRLLYGTVRDWLLGMRVVLPDGERIHCGGRVIKNVSGYDMNKLFIRSLGTLGIVTEVTFKLLPMPTVRAGVMGLFPELTQAWTAVKQALESFLLPEALDFLNPAAVTLLAPALGFQATAGSCGLAVALAGSPETVERQVHDFTALFKNGGGTVIPLPTERTSQAWEAIRNLLERASASNPARILCKIAVPIGRTGDLVAAAGRVGQNCGLQATVVAHAGSGVIWALYLPGSEVVPEERVVQALEGLRGKAVVAEGTLVLQNAPPALKRRVDAWGAPGDGFDVMRRLKLEFDPRGLCNPGRFVGGI